MRTLGAVWPPFAARSLPRWYPAKPPKRLPLRPLTCPITWAPLHHRGYRPKGGQHRPCQWVGLDCRGRRAPPGERTAVVPGTGKTITTGSLGNVMKESVTAAITYIRSVAEHYEIENTFYKDKDIHIHFPEDARSPRMAPPPVLPPARRSFRHWAISRSALMSL